MRYLYAPTSTYYISLLNIVNGLPQEAGIRGDERMVVRHSFDGGFIGQ